ncbi:MAG: type II toxin-antitoxin system RelE/ParE family toxin [Phycisphaerales bacterium]
MPRTSVVIYRELDGSVPLLDWLDKTPEKVRTKCVTLIELLSERGFDLRRPFCDSLEDGVYELRARGGNVHYRILYGFVGKNIVLLSHGCSKEKEVPPKEIRRAVRNLENYRQNPDDHTHKE